MPNAPALVRSAGIDMATYVRRCRQRWEVLDLSALAAPGAVDGDVVPPRLSQVFIPQACRRSRPAVALTRDYLKSQGLDPDEEERRLAELRDRWQREARLPALELIARPDVRRLVMLGDPGAGKSSLARYVVLRALDAFDRGTITDASWPVLVELRDLLAREAEGRCNDLLGYLGYVGEAHGFGFDRSALEARLREHASLFVVDGLDEIFDVARRRAVVEEIIGLESRFPRMRVLVTSRLAGFDARPLEAAGFTIATLDDLDADQMRQFGQGWFDLVFPGEPEKAERARSDLLDTIARRPQLSAIAGNPLILTIMAIIARHKRLARSRAQLYAQALEVLCYSWDYRRGLELPDDSPLADLQPEDTELMLRRVAWWMQENGGGLRANAIEESELKRILVEFFVVDWRFPPARAKRAAAEMLRLLQERNWILTRRGPRLYGFVHRTFLEYLCARELTTRFATQEITPDTLRDAHVLRRADDDSYHEVIRLLCGQLPPRVAGQIIHALCPTPANAVRAERRLLLAWQALGEIDPRQLAQAAEACIACLEALYDWLRRCDFEVRKVSGKELGDAIALVEPGTWPPSIALGNFPFSDAPTWFGSESVNVALARVIWLPSSKDRHHLMSLLTSPSVSDRRGAVLALGAQPTQDDSLFNGLKERATQDADANVRRAAVETLGARFAERADTYTLLRAWATQGADSAMRRAAVGTLGARFSGHAETYALLQAQATQDADASVRRTVIEMLGARFSKHAETYALLQAQATQDADASVRRTVIEMLGARFSEHAETYALLQARATQDADASVRRTVIEMLGARFSEHAETYTRLQARAVQDASAKVRQMAVQVLGTRFTWRAETYALLQARATQDSAADVRWTVVQMLGERFPGRAETYALLQARATQDANAYVRQVAIDALGARFAARAETYALLHARATQDVDAVARRAAMLALGGRAHTPFATVLLSQDVDGVAPGIDPRESIDEARLRAVVMERQISLDEVRGMYERLVDDDGFPLRLAWRSLPRAEDPQSR